MRIAIDGLHLFGPYSGVQHSLARQIAALRMAYPQDEFALFTGSDFKGPPDPGMTETCAKLNVHKTFFPSRWRWMRTLWRNFRLQPNVYAQNCDLLHGPTYTLPPLLTLPSVLTIHDLIAFTHPEFCTPRSARIQRSSLERGVQTARRIHVPTEAVKQQVLKILKVPERKIDVIPWGVGPEFKQITNRALLEGARQQWKLPRQFALCVGTLEPKKNIEGMVKAFVAAKMHKQIDASLVFAGRIGWGMQKLERLVRQLEAQNYIFFTGYVPDAALPLLYSLANVCLLASHTEGFGMTVLEAMACGCPLAISSIPALKEVAGDAAYVLEQDQKYPEKPMREALERWFERGGEEELAVLRAKGLRRAREFTWERTAKLTHASYENALSS